ncbi:MAG: NYN domain-containing protein, partial [Nanoarchaeota archaeon]|nr:NYN domain-containing protein [Nanoarchaeota archaeon]
MTNIYFFARNAIFCLEEGSVRGDTISKNKSQRIGVFVDVQNMYYSARQLYKRKVNFAAVLKNAVAGRSLIRALAYVIHADIKEEKNFFEALEKIGY